MKTAITLAFKELRDYFASPIAYVFISVFLCLSFWLFFSGVFLVGETSLRGFFGWLPLLFIILLPSITMGMWAEEKKSGTIELLLTLPARTGEIIIGKYLATVIFLTLVLLLTLPLVFIMEGLGDLDSGVVMGAYLGTFFLALSYLALGLFISSITKNQIVAFIITVLVLFLFYVIAEPLVTSYVPQALIPVLQFMSFNQHFAALSRGVVDTRDILFFMSAIFLFLYLNAVTLSLRKVA
ncbi:MAG: ABC transporter permease subunit [Deltaproteobacteria bacterium]|nr:ABC transporter permease subunit [Deltaproteobacteria bacterium]